MNPTLAQPEKMEATKRSYMMELLIGTMVVLLIAVYFWKEIFVLIPAGHKGVLFRTFGGTQIGKYYDEGLQFIFPWDEMYIYDTRIIHGENSIDALTRDGLKVSAQISYRYSPEPDSLGLIHKEIGVDYRDKVIIPHLTGATRDIISQYRIDDLYSTSRDDIQDEMLKRVKSKVDGHYPLITIDVVIRNIVLDTMVQKAIASKLVEEQKMLSYDFILAKERKEEERKQIEARGIRKFIDSSRIDILKWRGIEATQELAKSPNSKIIVIGSNRGDLPIILGGNQ